MSRYKQKPSEPAPSPEQKLQKVLEIDADGERIVLEAKKEIVLRCGKASITLTADGRIVHKGVELVSSASETNRIKGSRVKIN
jgi:uncharacterized protein (DUF2345 family)